MALSTNGSNGRSSHEALTRSLPETNLLDGRDTYAAALIVGPLANEDIVDFMRRGFAVRPFLEVDPALTELLLGQSTNRRRPAQELSRDDRTATATLERHVEISAPGKVGDRTYDGEFASQICKQLDPSLPNGSIREFFHLCAAKTRRRLTVDQAAQAIRVEWSRLNASLHEAGYPAAHEVLRQMRLLHACWLLSRTPRRFVDEIARALAFASGASMSNTMSAVMGLRPTELEKRGGYNVALVQFRRRLDQGKSREVRPEAQPATA